MERDDTKHWDQNFVYVFLWWLVSIYQIGLIIKWTVSYTVWTYTISSEQQIVQLFEQHFIPSVHEIPIEINFDILLVIMLCIKKISKGKQICYFKWLCHVSTKVRNDLGVDNDSVSYSPTINSDNIDKWLDIMKVDIKSMEHNI